MFALSKRSYAVDMCVLIIIIIYHWSKGPEAPTDFKATDAQETQVTLNWRKPELATQGGVSYTVSLIKLFFLCVVL